MIVRSTGRLEFLTAQARVEVAPAFGSKRPDFFNARSHVGAGFGRIATTAQIAC